MFNRANLLEQKNIFISCIIPVHNEADGILDFLKSLKSEISSFTNTFELIVVDDGSHDNSCQVIERYISKCPYTKLIELSRNFGKEKALTAGLEFCQGDVAILIDGDFQHPFELIKDFLRYWSDGYDMVYGIQSDRKESFIKKFFTKSFYYIMEKFSHVDMVANAGDFRLMDRIVIDSLKQCSERTRFMKGLYAWVGFKTIGLPFIAAKRSSGTSSWKTFKLFELALTGITSFSHLPLRIWSGIGLSIALCSFLFAVFIIIKTLIFGNSVPGYASIMVAIFFLGGVQLCSIGILGEYVSRIFNEVKQRPQYLIKRTFGF